MKELFRPGDVVGGCYEIRAILGEGGMGQVYEAYDRTLRRCVALKASLPSMDGAFLREEARALAAFNHPSVVTVYSQGQHNGIDYIVLERLYGTSLGAHMARRVSARDRMTPEDCLEIMIALADGLYQLHRASLAHRDLKPANIMLSPGNRVVLMDFGLVLPEADKHSSTEPAGTPQYMAPETVSKTAERGDRRLVDLYALGVLGFEMLTGQVPFPHDDPDKAMQRHLTDPVPDLGALRPDAPAPLVELILALLAKSPADRPQTAESVAWMLRQIRMHGSVGTDAPLSVLIVDDDVHSVRLLDLYVRESATQALIRTAGDGEQGLALAREKVPDLLLLDLQMPGMNGIELAMYLRATHLFDRCRIVALSGRAQGHDIKLLSELGITEFIPKDANTRTKLGQVVRDAARKRSRGALAGTATPR